MKSHFMIDLETMGLRPNSAIVSIGAVHFDAVNMYEKFHTAVNLSSCIEAGLVTDQSTVDWWARQSSEARSSWEVPDAPDLLTALSEFDKWLRTCAAGAQICPWGNGADYDIVLLVSAHRALDADPPWKFWNHHCFRTVKNLYGAPNDVLRGGTHHNALDDAIYQTQQLQSILRTNNITHLL